jgi:RNA polymerase sigma factor (sigma-70 family)
MVQIQLQTTIRRLRKLVEPRPDKLCADAELLERFVSSSDEAAFTALVHRHTPLVYAVCRRVLGQAADAEDAFQATFLVLARKAASIHKQQSLASWLHGVAFRTALSARKSTMRRRQREESADAPTLQSPVSEAALRELQSLLDAEVLRLPERLRSPFVLCCLEGKSRSEAARELHWKEGTVSSRLALARQKLRERLARRGVALSTALATIALEGDMASASMLAAAASQNALGWLSGPSNATERSVILAQGIVRAMPRMPTAWAGSCLLTLCLVLAGAFWCCLAQEPGAAAPTTGDKTRPASAQADKTAAKLDDVLEEAAAAARKALPKNPCGLLEEIAALQAKAGDKRIARMKFTEIYAGLAKLAEDAEPSSRGLLLANLACAQLRAGDTKAGKETAARALKFADSLKPENVRSDVLQYLARGLAQRGDIEDASEAAHEVEPPFYRGQVLADVLLGQAKAGDVTGAVSQTRTLEPFARTQFWIGLAEWRALSKPAVAKTDLENVRKALDKVEEESHQVSLMVRLAMVEARLGDDVAARKTYDAARLLARRSNAGVTQESSFLLQIAQSQCARGNHKAARKTLEDALAALGQNEEEWLPDLIAVRIALGDLRIAYRAIHRAPWQDVIRGEMVRQLAQTQAANGDAAGAHNWAKKETAPLLKAMALLGVAQGMAQPSATKMEMSVPTDEDINPADSGATKPGAK